MKIELLKAVKSLKFNYRRLQDVLTRKPPWNVLFFGTDEFSVYSLKALYNEYNHGTVLRKLEIVTTTKGKPNPVRQYAEEQKLLLHSWPVEVPDSSFDIGLVVSFGHLIPEVVINQFPLGMLNVHASLLPRWRGAAPIIYALANGDTETGVTIMRIRPKQFDIGEILAQSKIPVGSDMKMPELYAELGDLGARVLVDCLRSLPEKLAKARPQSSEGVTLAPKVTSEFAVIHWESMTSREVYNRERALTSLFPLTTSWHGIPVKLIGVTDFSEIGVSDVDGALLKPGFVKYDRERKVLMVVCANRTWVGVGKVGVYGRKAMRAVDFDNGYIKKVAVHNRYFNSSF
ncbi:hypothetical protein NQ315_008677 [Exocentrus adspersus]|uniref:Methionyl-tRNA formyltransferase, mitochondrial n=1 Tax=Exocentrus adspersus TaxID=1586481 RepID=A0AAV8W5Y9_9CUCU|nr:hypothetical protein NQ315_008677 [Exocentrus adspersus]